MLIEAGFALCAICLPSLSPAFKLKGVQTFFNNISHLFTLRSRDSAHHSASSTHGSNKALPSDLAKMESGSRTDLGSAGDRSIELTPLPNETKRNIIETAANHEYVHAK